MFTLQKETVRAALNGPDEPEEMEQEMEQEDQNDSASDDDFGFKAPKKAASKAASKPRTSTAPPRSGETAPGTATAPVNVSSAISEKGSTGNPDNKKVERGHGVLLTLDTFSPLAFWQGAAKASEWEKRVEKALGLVPGLEAMQEGDLAKDLQERADKIVSIMEDMGNLRDTEMSKFASGLFTESPEFLTRLLKFPADCIATILTDCGRKLLEAHGLCQN